MRPVTASSLERAIACLGSVILPAEEDVSGPGALRGTAIHEYIEPVLHGKIPTVPLEYEAFCNSINLDPIKQLIGWESFQTEMAFRFNVFTGDSGPLAVGKRDYPRAVKGDIFGTVDLVIDHEGKFTVVDYKTGQRTTPCADNWQMRFAALAIARQCPRDITEVRMILAYLGTNGQWEFDSYDADIFDLDLWAYQLKDFWTALAKADGEYAEGVLPDVAPSADNCRWCLCKSSCPSPFLLPSRRAKAPTLKGNVYG